MTKFAANLSLMFTEVPFLDRFAAASKAGFSAVEYLFPYDFSKEELRAKLDEHGLKQALFNLYAGDWESGERGMAAIAGREEQFRESVSQALEYAVALNCPKIHVMAGNCQATTQSNTTYVANVQIAADAAAVFGIQVLIEPINARNMPDYFLSSVDQALSLLEEIGRPNVGLQFDYYHAQITEGDVTTLMRRCIKKIKHVQIASVPDRHEPDDGELDYRYVLAQLEEAGYDGWVGCEYNPIGDTVAGLNWLAEYQEVRS